MYGETGDNELLLIRQREVSVVVRMARNTQMFAFNVVKLDEPVAVSGRNCVILIANLAASRGIVIKQYSTRRFAKSFTWKVKVLGGSILEL